MGPSASQYERARTAFQAADWRHFPGASNWEGYLFTSVSRLELFWSRDPRLHPLFDLRNCAVKKVVVNLQPRDDGATVTGVPRLTFSLGENMDSFTFITGATESITELELRNLGQSTHLTFDSGSADHSTRPVIYVREGDPGSVSLRGIDFTLSSAVRGAMPTFNAEDSNVSLQIGAKTAHLAGECRLDHGIVGGFEDLTVADGTSLSVGGPRQSGQTSLEASSFRVERKNANEFGSVELKKGDLIVNRTSNSAVKLDPSATFVIRIEASDLLITGAGTTDVRHTAERLEFRVVHPSAVPKLRLKEWAVLQDASGAVRLGACQDAQIIGDPKVGLTIQRLTQDDKTDGPPTSGLTIRDFDIPIGLSGLSKISALTATASVAVPMLTKALPGHRQERREMKGPARSPDEHVRADYAAALAGLAESRGAPGSVRTRLAWQEYRMREATAKFRTERWTLRAYRLIGYGERVVPPFLLFVGLVVAFTTLSLLGRPGDLSLSGVADVFFTWFLSPLHLLRLGEPVAVHLGPGWLEFLMRIAIAIPFITAVFALRKYVKRSRGDVS